VQLQEHLENYLEPLLDEDFKVDITWIGPWRAGLPRELNHNSTLEDFFMAERPIDVSVWLVILSQEESLEDDKIIEKARNVVVQLYATGAFEGGIFWISYTEDSERFQLLDTSIDEKVRRDYYRGRHASPRHEEVFITIFWESFRAIIEESRGNMYE